MLKSTRNNLVINANEILFIDTDDQGGKVLLD